MSGYFRLVVKNKLGVFVGTSEKFEEGDGKISEIEKILEQIDNYRYISLFLDLTDPRNNTYGGRPPKKKPDPNIKPPEFGIVTEDLDQYKINDHPITEPVFLAGDVNGDVDDPIIGRSRVKAYIPGNLAKESIISIEIFD